MEARLKGSDGHAFVGGDGFERETVDVVEDDDLALRVGQSLQRRLESLAALASRDPLVDALIHRRQTGEWHDLAANLQAPMAVGQVTAGDDGDPPTQGRGSAGIESLERLQDLLPDLLVAVFRIGGEASTEGVDPRSMPVDDSRTRTLIAANGKLEGRVGNGGRLHWITVHARRAPQVPCFWVYCSFSM